MELVNKILMKTLGIIRITDKNKQGIDSEVRELMEEKRKICKETNSIQNEEEQITLINKRKEIEDQIRKKIIENEERSITEMINNNEDL